MTEEYHLLISSCFSDHITTFGIAYFACAAWTKNGRPSSYLSLVWVLPYDTVSTICTTCGGEGQGVSID